MKLPTSLTALRAFVEAARCGSMKRAGESLGVTSGAISQQVKIVESALCVQLFKRTNKELQLTAEGRRLLDALNEPFHLIEQNMRVFKYGKQARRPLIVTTVPSFASSWLVPYLGKFSELNPQIEVRVETDVAVVDLRRRHIDCAIRHGSGNYQGLDVTLLASPNLIPIGSRQVLDNGPSIKSAADCLRFPLLQDRDRYDWSLWLEANGVEDTQGLASQGSSFADDSLLIQAATSSQGLAVVRDIYARDALSRGIVEIAYNNPLKTSTAYYFVTKPDLADCPVVSAFRDWLLSEMAAY